MVSNLMVVLCGESEVHPVVNTGTLYTDGTAWPTESRFFFVSTRTLGGARGLGAGRTAQRQRPD